MLAKQKKVLLKTKRILEDTIKDLLCNFFPTRVKVADLGCSSGHNTFLTVSEIDGVIHEICQQAQLKLPEFQAFLNDLPKNGFHVIFRFLPAFLEKLKREKGDLLGHCSILGVPGSFYGRLFLSRGLLFTFFSCSSELSCIDA
ncbi:S-adenosyl-L-methionine-dependent methyltransferases superfamily protein, putative [Theobroma cacao]|uniref:S-adenosyl-L-methionine-dependent methyltransferases superfamily protein, putative n=1 Tax=Theobroma cacao TaxID=3641 RepID=A0A061DM04_THECC|nr:S-adenosyl-L-methionine-dependent methyltransferases superfamily protein, putative [Theobroma cacao]